MNRTVALLIVCLVALAGRAELGKLVLAERGKVPGYSIVVPQKAGASCLFAADELREFIRRITGTQLAVITNRSPERAIYLRIDPKSEGDNFTLKADGRNLRIEGGTRGVLYGVYEILERFGGVGWFSSWRELVPEADWFAVPANLAEAHKPCFRMRMTTWKDTRVTPEFKARLRLNSSMRDYSFSDDRFAKYAPEKFGGHACKFAPKLGISHTFETFVPQSKYFKDHPEYYSEINGVRRHGRTQLCLTNPDVFRIVVERILATVREHPESEIVGFSSNDCDCHCECAKCKAIDDEEGSPTGSLVRFLNKVAEEVGKTYPKLLIETLAYQYTRHPPKKTKLHPNILPILCAIECDYSRPLAEAGKPKNEKFMADLKKWSKLTDNLGIWDYTTDYHGHLYPYPNLVVMQDNLRLYRDYGVKFMFEEGGAFHADFAEFKAYLLSKWMWDPEIPYEELEAKFVKGYFGAAAPYAKRYLDRFWACCRRPVKNHYFWCFAADCPEMFDDEFIDWALRNWNEAETAVKDDWGARYAVRTAKLVPLVTKLERWAAVNPRVWATYSPEKFKVPVAEIRDCYKQWRKIIDEVVAYRKEGVPLGCSYCSCEHPPRDWKKLYTQKIPTSPEARGVVSVDEFEWDSTRARNGKDEGSMFAAKQAIQAYNHGDTWSVHFKLRNLAFDSEGSYRVRVRARAVRAPNGRGEAFIMRIGKAFKSVSAEELNDDRYHWYDLGEMQLDRDWKFQFGNGRFDKGGGSRAVKESWIDAVEFTRIR